MLFHLQVGEQSEFPIWENILLIHAATPDEAHEKATARAREDETNYQESGLTLNNKPAELKFLGLRKLIQCISDEEQPSDGTEVSYNQITFADREQLDLFVAGDEAQLTIENEWPWEPEDED